MKGLMLLSLLLCSRRVVGRQRKHPEKQPLDLAKDYLSYNKRISNKRTKEQAVSLKIPAFRLKLFGLYYISNFWTVTFARKVKEIAQRSWNVGICFISGR